MRDVVLYTLLALDGVAEAPDRFVLEFDDEMREHLAEVVATQDTVLLGRRSYDEWAGYWPGSDEKPFAPFINTVEKYVATSSPLDQTWTGASAMEPQVEDFVRDLKAQPGGDIGLHGSIALAQSLIAADLVDRYRLVVVPRTAPGGRRLFAHDEIRALELVSCSATSSGALLLDYRRRA